MRGSSAVTAAADLLVGLYRNEGRTTLKVEGRDADARELALRFDRATCTWDLLGDAREVAREESDAAFLDLVDELGEVDIKGAVDALGDDRTKWQRVAKRLYADGLLDKRRDGARFVYFRRKDPPDPEAGTPRTPRTPRTDPPGGVQRVRGVGPPAESTRGEAQTSGATRPPPSLFPGPTDDLTARDVLARFPEAQRVTGDRALPTTGAGRGAS